MRGVYAGLGGYVGKGWYDVGIGSLSLNNYIYHKLVESYHLDAYCNTGEPDQSERMQWQSDSILQEQNF